LKIEDSITAALNFLVNKEKIKYKILTRIVVNNISHKDVININFPGKNSTILKIFNIKIEKI
jgi:hypothetical protein